MEKDIKKMKKIDVYIIPISDNAKEYVKKYGAVVNINLYCDMRIKEVINELYYNFRQYNFWLEYLNDYLIDNTNEIFEYIAEIGR